MDEMEALVVDPVNRRSESTPQSSPPVSATPARSAGCSSRLARPARPPPGTPGPAPNRKPPADRGRNRPSHAPERLAGASRGSASGPGRARPVRRAVARTRRLPGLPGIRRAPPATAWPPRRVAPLGGQHGQVAPGQVAVDPLIDAGKTARAAAGPGSAASTPRPRPTRRGAGAPPPCGTTARRPRGRATAPRRRSAAPPAESPSIWCARAIRANSFRVIESVGAEPRQAPPEEPERLVPVAAARWRSRPG